MKIKTIARRTLNRWLAPRQRIAGAHEIGSRIRRIESTRHLRY